MFEWLRKQLRGKQRTEQQVPQQQVLQQAQEAVSEERYVVGHEPIERDGVYNLCYQPPCSQRISPRIYFQTGRYVAVLDAAADGSLAFELEHQSRHEYHRKPNTHIFVRPLSVLTAYDVFDVFWRNCTTSKPLFPDHHHNLFASDDIPVLYREGGLELLTEPVAMQQQQKQ